MDRRLAEFCFFFSFDLYPVNFNHKARSSCTKHVFQLMSKFTDIKLATGELHFAPLCATGTYRALQQRKTEFKENTLMNVC